MVCRHCGKEFPDDAKYCPYCAEPVPVARTEGVSHNTKKNCWNCGEENITDAVYCLKCGQKLSVNKFFARVAHEVVKKQIMDVCPRCYSKNIKIYRKGYDYKVGFWGAIFGVRGAGYAGGFDANKACCRCMNCGKDWETDHDYRLL